MANEPSNSRRRFLVRSAAAVAAPAVLPAFGCGGSGGASTGGTTTPSGPTAVAMVDALPATGAMHVESDNIILVRSEDGGVGAMSDICPHAGCAVHPEGEGFDCDCHGSSFDMMGHVLTPPARDDLEWFAVTITGGEVFVDKDTSVPAGTYVPVG